MAADRALDVFISYAREDLERARVLAEALEGLGWSVFWDRAIPAGSSWRKHVGRALERARAVVVGWSGVSVESDWVIQEAEEGSQREVLVPVLFEPDVLPPLGLRHLQAADVAAWAGDPQAPEFRQFVADLGRLLGPPPGELEAEEDRARLEAKAEAERQARARETEQEAQRRREVEVDERQEEAGGRGAALVALLRSGPGLAVGAVALVAVALLAWLGPWRNGTVTQTDSRRPSVRVVPDWDEDETLNRRVLIDAASFVMGSPEGIGDLTEQPIHEVRLSSFYIQEHEVTNEEFARFEPSYQFEREEGRLPVANTTWQEANDYARWLDGQLPTEAQWEYAAKGGCLQDYCLESGEETTLDELAWHRGNNPDGKPKPVMGKEPNQHGLYDIYGNVPEWVVDCYGGYPAVPLRDPRGPPEGPDCARVIRGDSSSSTRRKTSHPYVRRPIGFRVAWPADQEPS